MTTNHAPAGAFPTLTLAAALAFLAPPWGAHGHRIAGEAAARGLPPSMPSFFRDRSDQLAWLDAEPDRWRGRGARAAERAFAYDHYIDLERVPGGALDAADRWRFLDALHRAGMEEPASGVGLLPFRILELQQRLVGEWRRWREATNLRERRWIEDRIVDDAGILGHYVTDASQPQHTTIHFNGWAEGVPNPEGYPTDRSFHTRFETTFVGARVELDDLLAVMGRRRPRRIDDVRAAILAHIREAHERVEELYRLDRDVGFSPDRADARTVRFAVERLVSGAEMLQDLWWTAWLESAR
ncbi:MAG TPA: hypothetical protein VE173_09375 [Longimicrobiales bacterium]|nr:hypothetical protein [Longimicrobiales bacterium]